MLEGEEWPSEWAPRWPGFTGNERERGRERERREEVVRQRERVRVKEKGKSLGEREREREGLEGERKREGREEKRERVRAVRMEKVEWLSLFLSLCSDLGMMPEAEELLSDICRFYSEDQWLELSAPSYALLADCQKSLELEDQYPPLTCTASAVLHDITFR